MHLNDFGASSVMIGRGFLQKRAGPSTTVGRVVSRFRSGPAIPTPVAPPAIPSNVYTTMPVTNRCPPGQYAVGRQPCRPVTGSGSLLEKLRNEISLPLRPFPQLPSPPTDVAAKLEWERGVIAEASAAGYPATEQGAKDYLAAKARMAASAEQAQAVAASAAAQAEQAAAAAQANPTPANVEKAEVKAEQATVAAEKAQETATTPPAPGGSLVPALAAAGAGFMVGGPVGAVVGLIAGSKLFGKK